MRTAAALVLGLAASTSAFIQPAFPVSSTKARSTTALSMSASLPKSQIAARELEAGITAPFPNTFDPLGLSKDKSFKELKRWREAELKHGRVAMLAVLGSIVQENFHPLWGFADKNLDGAAVQFQEIQAAVPYFWTVLLWIIALTESQTIHFGWDDVKVGENKIAGIKDSYITGNLFLDPLGIIKKDDVEAFLDYRNKELNNGRLAMLAIAGILVQERFITNGAPEFHFF